jgi:hypothetical protein
MERNGVVSHHTRIESSGRKPRTGPAGPSGGPCTHAPTERALFMRIAYVVPTGGRPRPPCSRARWASHGPGRPPS